MKIITLAILAFILVLSYGCSSHPSIMNPFLFGKGSSHPAPATGAPAEEVPTCPVCGQPDPKSGHTNKGHHYGQFKHHANG